ncbi:MAG: ATPase, T2SS/T4P/T4SS family [Acidimicrobiales bacterium]
MTERVAWTESSGMDELDELLRCHLRDRPVTDRSTPDRAALAELVRAAAPLVTQREVARVVDRALARVDGLGPILPLLDDPTVTEIMINGPGSVWIDGQSGLRQSGITLDLPSINVLIERVLDPLGLRVDRRSPIADARLRDGSRVNVVIPPLALDGPTVTIRRFAPGGFDVTAFADPAVVALIARLVEHRATMLIVGGTGAGKTSLLNAVGSAIDREERVVTIEDTAELAMTGAHIVRLEARPANTEGAGSVTIRDLVKASLRMRPDRLVVGEVRGAEALDLLLALTSGHEGSLATCHAGSPQAAVRRLGTLALLAGAELPLGAVAGLIASAFDIVIMVRRVGAKRRIVSIAEVDEADGLVVRELWPNQIEAAKRPPVRAAIEAAVRCTP